MISLTGYVMCFLHFFLVPVCSGSCMATVLTLRCDMVTLLCFNRFLEMGTLLFVAGEDCNIVVCIICIVLIFSCIVLLGLIPAQLLFWEDS